MLAFLCLGIVLFFCAIMIGEKCNLIVFICISLIINKDKHLFICFLAIYVLSIPTGCLFMTFADFFHWSPCLSLKIYKHCYILQILILGFMLQTCHNQFLSLFKVFAASFDITVFHCHIVTPAPIFSFLVFGFRLCLKSHNPSKFIKIFFNVFF